MHTPLIIRVQVFVFAVVAIVSAQVVAEIYKPQSCTIFTSVQNGTVLFGNNEDWHSPDLLVGFNPGSAAVFGSVNFGFRHSDGSIEFGGAVNEQGLAWDVNSIPRAKLNPHPERPYSHARDNYLSTITKEATTVEEAIHIAHLFDFGDGLSIQIHVADAAGDAVVISPGSDGEMAFTRKSAGDGFLVSTNFNLATREKGPKDFRYGTANSMLEKLGVSQDLTADYAAEILNAVHLNTLTSYTLYSDIIDLKQGDVYLYYFSQYDEVFRLSIVDELAKGQRVVEMRDLFSPDTVAAGDASYRRFETRFRIAKIMVITVILGLSGALVRLVAKRLRSRKFPLSPEAMSLKSEAKV